MEPKENKFQQPQKNSQGNAIGGRIVPKEEQAVNNSLKKQIDRTESSPMPELKKGSQGDTVKEAQRILKSNSDYIGYVDGDFGRIMETSVKTFQRRHKLPVTGIIDSKTWDVLMQHRR